MKKFISIFQPKNIPWITLVIYATGFFIWNVYLSSFGFFEYNLIQIRYLSAGLLLWIPVVLLLLLCLYIWEHLFHNHFLGVSLFLIPSVVGVVIILSFSYIPQYLGGGKPISTTIIGTPDQIAYLDNFGVRSAENGGRASVQTYPICLIYQNDNYALFFSVNNISTSTGQNGLLDISFNARVLSISRNNFIGFQSTSGQYSAIECSLPNALYSGTVLIPVN